MRTPESLGVQLVLQHTTVISPNLIARPSRNRSEFAIVSEESQVATTESLVSTRVSRGKLVANGRIHSTLRDRPPSVMAIAAHRKQVEGVEVASP